MKNHSFTLILFICISSAIGCSQTQEVVRTFWGSSTRVLQQARKDGLSKFLACDPQECFDAVLGLTKAPVSNEVQPYQLFLKDKQRLTIVLVGIPGSVDTTEVGVFFKSLESKKTLIEISSLSSHAKMTAADFIFNALESKYPAFP